MSKWLRSIKRKASKAADAVSDAASKAKETVSEAAVDAKGAVGGAIDGAQASIQKKLDQDVLDAYLSGAMLLVSSDGEVGDEYDSIITGLQSSPTLSQFTAMDVRKGMKQRLEELVEDPEEAREEFHEDLCDINKDIENSKMVLAVLKEHVYDGTDDMQEALGGVIEALNLDTE